MSQPTGLIPVHYTTTSWQVARFVPQMDILKKNWASISSWMKQHKNFEFEIPSLFKDLNWLSLFDFHTGFFLGQFFSGLFLTWNLYPLEMIWASFLENLPHIMRAFSAADIWLIFDKSFWIFWFFTILSGWFFWENLPYLVRVFCSHKFPLNKALCNSYIMA